MMAEMLEYQLAGHLVEKWVDWKGLMLAEMLVYKMVDN